MTSNDEHPEVPISDLGITNITDADMAARWAAIALEQGRYELGRVLATVAATAHRADVERARARRDQDNYLMGTPAGRDPGKMTVAEIEEDALFPAAVACSDQWQPPHHAGAYPEACATCSDTAAPGPTGNGKADVPALASDAKTEIFGRPEELQLAVPAAARCQFVLTIADASGTEQQHATCWRPIWWQETPGANGHTGRWLHIDPSYDDHHAAQPPQHWTPTQEGQR